MTDPKEQAVILQEMVEKLLPDEEEFVPTPLKSSKQKREELRTELVDFLKMGKLTQELVLGANTVIEELHNNPIYHSDSKSLLEDIDRLGKYLKTEEIKAEDMLDLERKVGLSMTTLESIYQIGVDQYEKGEYEKASAIAVFLILLKMDMPPSWLLRGMASRNLGLYDLAIDAYTMMTVYVQDDPCPYLYLADCWHHEGDQKKASEALVEAEKRMTADQQEEWRHFSETLKKKIYE